MNRTPRIHDTAAQRGRGAQPGERDHVASLLSKANTAGANRPTTTRDTFEAMDRAQRGESQARGVNDYRRNWKR